MVNPNVYRSLVHLKKYDVLLSRVECDMEEILEIEPSKRNVKQKKALGYLQQLKREAERKKVNLEVISKLNKLYL